MNVLLNTKKDLLKIKQETWFVNKSNDSLTEIYFHNWANGYRDNETPLGKRLIEDYRKDLYFAKSSDRGHSKILNLTIDFETVNYQELKEQSDIIKIGLSKALAPGDSLQINTTYEVKIPQDRFTGYGKTKTGYHLRYWYLSPAIYKEGWELMSNLNIDDLIMESTNFDIFLKTDSKLFLNSNLSTKKENDGYRLTGKNYTDIVLHLDSQSNFTLFNTTDFELATDLSPKGINNKLATDLINRELEFIKSYLGDYPHKKMLIDKNTQEKNPIYGLNQLPDFLSPFSDVFEWDMTIFKALTKAYIENTLLLDKRNDYWLTDGLQTYLLIEYANTYYPEVKLLGKISKIWGVRGFNFSKLNFNDKYPFVYQFSTRKFLDQALTTRADSLSNFNRKIAAKYKAGLGLQYLKGYLGDSVVKESFQDFYQQKKLQYTNSSDFRAIITSKTDKDLNWFFGDYLQTNKKIDYTIKKVQLVNDSLDITIKNKRNITAPVALYGVKNKEIKFKEWFTGIDSSKTVRIPKGDFDKVSLNYEQLYPEYNSLDNWKNVKKTLLDKPIQLRFIKDIEDPYYHQLFYQPELSYNYYDGLGLGLKLHNKPILARNLTFKIAPTYATKSNSITGYFSLMYKQYFESSKIHNISYGLFTSNSHYAPELSYSTFAPYIAVAFRRNSLRDVGGKSLTAKLVSVHKEVAPGTAQQEKDIYSVFNLNYFYSKPNIIEGLQYKINADFSAKFTKLSGDLRYRKLTATNRQLDFRVFAGFFLNNKTQTNYFSFGLDRPSDYLFEQLYFGRSESKGIFSQQVIISDGGFKSILPTRYANQFMISLNSSIGLWNWIEYYNDVAFLKNKNSNTYFAYENGIRFNFIHNILELYFPVYSNLGWEVTQEAYPSKIRFVLTVRPTTIYNFFRRGFL
ncbi:aminopeptidase [Polaribacter pacificus]|nr:aminopeptidase [Polaribacter pacificus]